MRDTGRGTSRDGLVSGDGLCRRTRKVQEIILYIFITIFGLFSFILKTVLIVNRRHAQSYAGRCVEKYHNEDMLLTLPRCAKALQLTLAVIKPDAVAHPVMLEALHQRILENNFVIVRCKNLSWRRADSERFYAEHAGRFFFQRLVEFMSSGPMRAYILGREDAITHWRELMGPTKVFRAQHTSPATIRAQFGLTDTRNSTHGSDSVESARREINFFFPDFSMEDWMREEEPLFRVGEIKYDQQRQIHTLQTES